MGTVLLAADLFDLKRERAARKGGNWGAGPSVVGCAPSAASPSLFRDTAHLASDLIDLEQERAARKGRRGGLGIGEGASTPAIVFASGLHDFALLNVYVHFVDGHYVTSFQVVSDHLRFQS
jgi:hypothetical protein